MTQTGAGATPDRPYEAAHRRPPTGRGWKIGFIVLAVVLGLAIVAAVVWGVMSATGSPAPAPATTTAAPTPTATPTPSPTPTPTPTPVAAPCTGGQLTITLGTPEGTAGSTVVPLVFTNNGAPCLMQGYPQVAFVGDDNGTQLGAAATPDSTTPVTSFELATGGVAQATLTVAVAQNFDSCDVQTANGFRVYPPSDSGAVFVPTTDYDACLDSSAAVLTVGALTAG